MLPRLGNAFFAIDTLYFVQRIIWNSYELDAVSVGNMLYSNQVGASYNLLVLIQSKHLCVP